MRSGEAPVTFIATSKEREENWEQIAVASKSEVASRHLRFCCELAKTESILVQRERRRQSKSEVKRKKEEERRVGRGELRS
jgi:hypothetical protein